MVISHRKIIEFPIEDSLIKKYKLRRAFPASNTVEVSVPRDFIRKLARKAGISYGEFIEQYRAVVYYGGGDELLYRFEKVNGD